MVCHLIAFFIIQSIARVVERTKYIGVNYSPIISLWNTNNS